MTPSLVHSVNSTSATRVGSTKTDPRGGFGPVAASANGESSRRSSTFGEAVELGLGEARADATREAQPAVLLDADEQRPDAVLALARRPAPSRRRRRPRGARS